MRNLPSVPAYTPANWFWIVAGSAAQVYSSAAAAFLAEDDARCIDWLAAGNRPTRIASEAELWEVLQAQYPAGLQVLPATADDVMVLIKAERDRRRVEGGVKVGGHWFKSDNQAVSEYTAMALLGTSIPGTTVLRDAWRTMQADTTVPMTPNLAKQILFAGFSSLAAIDDAALAHLTALQASSNPAAYDWSGGWPAVFVAVA